MRIRFVLCLALLVAFFAVRHAEACDYGAALSRYGNFPGQSFQPSCQAPVAFYGQAVFYQPAAYQTFQAAPFYGFPRSFAIGQSYGQQGVPFRSFNRGSAVGVRVHGQRSFGAFQAPFVAPAGGINVNVINNQRRGLFGFR